MLSTRTLIEVKYKMVMTVVRMSHHLRKGSSMFGTRLTFSRPDDKCIA